MRLKDVNINAEDLINFLNKHVKLEESDELGDNLNVKFVYKLQLSQVTSFIEQQHKTQIEKSLEQVRNSKYFLHTHKSDENEIIFRISGLDLKDTLDKNKDVR